MQRLKGIGVSPGFASGRAVMWIQRAQVLRYQVAPARVAGELARLQMSGERSREQLTGIRSRMAAGRAPELAALFDTQLLMLDDPMLMPRAVALVDEQRINADWALAQVLDEIRSVFAEVADPYLRERQGDVADLIGRLRMNLRIVPATPRELLEQIEDASILIADELTPSIAAQVDWTKVRGFATDAGSRTSHTAILARSLDVPAIVGLHDASLMVQPGQMVLVDADSGELVLDPDPASLARAARYAVDREPAHSEPAAAGCAATADGVSIRLEANIEFPEDLADARYAGAEGIGLFRTELTLSGADEEAQYEVYRRMLEDMAPQPVTIRTFDLDVEQIEEQIEAQRHTARSTAWTGGEERAGRHGLRGLRLSLERPALFRTQLRALLRASRHGNLRVLLPFVSSVEQVRAARAAVAATATELGGGPEPSVPVGIMIEIPAAAYTADLLAKEVDFFTIGTNDLIQYCLALDRADERVSHLYQPLHPAILRVIMMVRRAAARARIPVALCGEMAADPVALGLLVGLGLTAFSMAPSAMRTARQTLAESRSADLRTLARRVLRLPTAEAIERELLARSTASA